MTHADCPDDDLEKITLARNQRRQGRAQRGCQGPVDTTIVPQAEYIDTHDAVEKLAVPVNDPRWHARKIGNSGVGRGKQVLVDLEHTAVIEIRGAEIVGFRQRHVAAVAVVLGLRRVVEARYAVTGHAAQVVGIVMVLAPQPFVMIELLGQMHFVAGATIFRSLVQRFQKRFLVKFRLRLEDLPIDPP